MYYALVPASSATDNGPITTHFDAYVRQNHKVNDNATAGATGAGRCQRFSNNDPASRANSPDNVPETVGIESNIESIHVNWTNTPAENAAIDAKLAGTASAAATAAATLYRSGESKLRVVQLRVGRDGRNDDARRYGHVF